MRDPRFVAQHRGGLLEVAHHRLLAAWAADVAEHRLDLFEAHASDQRPRVAIETARAWSRGEVPVGAAQKAAVAAHAAAREAKHPAATAVARAAGHAVATAHMADHSFGAVVYVRKAMKAAGATDEALAAERAWQMERLPQAVRELVIAGLSSEKFRKHV